MFTTDYKKKILLLAFGVTIVLFALIFISIIAPIFIFLNYSSNYRLIDSQEESLTLKYLEALSRGDDREIIKLAGKDRDCQNASLGLFPEYKNSEIRNIGKVRVNLGNHEDLNFTSVKFEYRKDENSDWQDGLIGLNIEVDNNGFFSLLLPKKHICGCCG